MIDGLVDDLPYCCCVLEQDVQLAYNVDRLTSLSRELRDVVDARKYAQTHNAR